MGRALCTRDDVKLVAGIDSADDEFDDVIDEFLPQAGEAIHRRAGREFIDSGAGETRVRDIGYFANGVTNGFVEVPLPGDATTITAVVVKDWLGNVLAQLDFGVPDYVLLPRTREPWQPFTRIRILPTSVLIPGLVIARHWNLTFTGTWGFPEIPDDLVRAAAKTVKDWLDLDVRSASEAAGETAAMQPDGYRPIPRTVLPIVDAYAPVGV